MGPHQKTILLITFGTIILIAIGITLFIVFKPKKVHHGKVPP